MSSNWNSLRLLTCTACLLLTFIICSKNTFSQKDCESSKQEFLRLIKEGIMSEDWNLCPQECKIMNNVLQEVTVYIKSVPCSEVNEATFNHFSAKAEEIRQKYQSQVDNCYSCINTKKGNINETPVPGNNTPESLMQFIDQAEQLNRLTNITSFAMGELNANDRMKQSMLNEINSRDLSDKIKLLPNIPEEQYSNDKQSMENGLYGGVNSDKYRNSLGSPEAKSLDEILNKKDTLNGDKKISQKPNSSDSTCKISSAVSKDDVYQGLKINGDDANQMFYKLGYKDGFHGTSSFNPIILFALSQEDPKSASAYWRGKSVGKKDKANGAKDFFSGNY